AGAGAHLDREGRALAAVARRPVGERVHRPRRGGRRVGRAGCRGAGRAGGTLQPPVRTGGPEMTTAAAAPPPVAHAPGWPGGLERRHWLAALAMLFVLFAPYQTLVQTVLTDDAVRKGVEVDDYDMTWVTVAYGVGVLYGVFTALWLSARIGARYTIMLGLVGFD